MSSGSKLLRATSSPHAAQLLETYVAMTEHCAALQKAVDPDGRVAQRLWDYVWETVLTTRPRAALVYQLLCALRTPAAKL